MLSWLFAAQHWFRRDWFRLVAAGAQAVTIGLTWPLWQERAMPPMLPACQLPQVDMGWPLLATLATFVVLPGLGWLLHAAVLVLAILMDQTRLQPEFISLSFLMLATLPTRAPRLLGRLHLAALWFFSGFHKLVSFGYFEVMARRLWTVLLPEADPRVAFGLSLAVATTEVLLGIFTLVPGARRSVAIVALPLHIGIVASLAAIDWNRAVWPWNIALALAGFGLLWNWRESVWFEFRQVGWLAKAAALAILVSPLGYYLGIVDAYLAHCLYSANVPMATMNGQPLVGATMNSLGVPLPPTYRTYEAFFRKIARPGDKLVIDDPRWCARRQTRLVEPPRSGESF